MCDICKINRKLKENNITDPTLIDVAKAHEDLIREKFESMITRTNRTKNSLGRYTNSIIENQWKGFKWGFESKINL